MTTMADVPAWLRTHPLLRINEQHGTRWVALRVGISVLIPQLVLLGIHHQEWSLYATFGAFTSLYGRWLSHRGQFRMQSTLAAVLTACVALGVLIACLDERAWLAVPVAATAAVVGAVVSDLQQWHPPGPMFPVFALAACSSVPSHPSDVLPATIVAAGSAALSVALGLVGTVRTGWGSLEVAPTRRTDSELLRHASRAMLSVLVAGSAATAVGIGRPYWAMVAAVVPFAARGHHAQLTRATQRVLGTTIGILMAALVLSLNIHGIALQVAIAGLLAVAELIVGRNYGFALIVITPMALLTVHAVDPLPIHQLIWQRWIETLIGAVVGGGIGYLTRERAQET